MSLCILASFINRAFYICCSTTVSHSGCIRTDARICSLLGRGWDSSGLVMQWAPMALMSIMLMGLLTLRLLYVICLPQNAMLGTGYLGATWPPAKWLAGRGNLDSKALFPPQMEQKLICKTGFLLWCISCRSGRSSFSTGFTDKC